MHTISYKNTPYTWDEALPIGNGHYGAMVYNERNRLIYAINHYDVYYKKHWPYANIVRNAAKETINTDLSRYNKLMERALIAHENPDDPAHMNYDYALRDSYAEIYGAKRVGQTNLMAGEIHLLLNDDFEDSFEYASNLEIENAFFKYHASYGQYLLDIKSLVSRSDDVILTEVKQDGENAIKAIEISAPARKFLKSETEYRIVNSNTIYLINNVVHDDYEGKNTFNFKYILKVRIVNAEFKNVSVMNDKLSVDVINAEPVFYILSCVVSEDEADDIIGKAEACLDSFINQLAIKVDEHQDYWKDFWSKSSINIPDKMLEKLWYMGLYSLECSCGKGSKYPEFACGLNGLWDIMQPTQWGSMWYWDVNIQQSFWPVFTSNHLDIGECFYNGLLSYVDAAKSRAKERYGIDGIAADYPFECFMSIWPWCAQFFWWQYKYSGDLKFLREKAFPLFKGILEFFEAFLKFDEENNCYYIFPDISPEEGPVTRNSVISLACLKYLIKTAVASSSLLGEREEEREKWENILAKLPAYDLCESKSLGVTILRHSEWSDPDFFLGHGSIFMPIYPIGEISKRSPNKIREIGLNTLKDGGTRLSLCTHIFGWEACTAARLGYGDEALWILYEKGIAFQMRANGLFAEETDRWMQNCVTALAPAYHPPLMEASSAVTATINEMLLQSFDGIIEVFPAMPSGTEKPGPSNSRYESVVDISYNNFTAWEDSCFENLLAEGSFEVSAWQKGGEISLIRIRSLQGNKARLINPFNKENFTLKSEGSTVGYELTGNVINFNTQKGKVYEIIPDCTTNMESTHKAGSMRDNNDCTNVEIYTAPSKRRVFLGKDQDTDYLRGLDSMTFDYYQGDIRSPRVSVYRFDFSKPEKYLHKDYSIILPKQFHACGKIGLDFTRISKDSQYSKFIGYGWKNTEGLDYIDRNTKDPFRRDFIFSKEKHDFLLDLVKGYYMVLIVTGDYLEKTYTVIEMNGQERWEPNHVISPGRFRTVMFPIRHDVNDVLKISFSTIPEHEWKLNMLIANRLL